jgi:CheY-like chemotaxis protein
MTNTQVAQTTSSKHVLVVEDDFDIRDLLVMILNNNGYQAAGVSNGQEALAHLKRTQATNLILLDLMMPIMDAWEFRERQQRHPQLKGIPVVLLSATDEVNEHVIPLKAAAYLRKPIDFGALLETVGLYC